ncbi:MAG TPA: DNA methyltransferase [Candidatus Tripitaka californicus]|uniref:DNA methyltransferase n=1 Tax=Candidatus Tripitaka californicus TaxID=3367616 RepID=UPI0040251CD9
MVEKYSEEGHTVLDPMAGIGTTLLAALMGRNVICVEKEAHFVEPMRASWEKMRQHPMLGYSLGQVQIHQGDARDLGWLVPVDCAVTSPPWEDKTALQESQRLYAHEAELAERFRQSHAGEKGLPGNTKPANRSTMQGYTRPVDAVLTSPPWEDTEASKGGKFADPVKSAEIQSANYRSGQSKGHFASSEAILRAMDKMQPYAPGSGENIGNQRGQAYWDSVRQVYAECYRVLKPGGIMALVLKGFTHNSQYIDLPAQTEALLLEAGWLKHDEWRREVHLSFWRILQQRKDPEHFDNRLRYETVLAFKKPLEE